MAKIDNVNDFLKNIRNIEHNFDVLTSGTLGVHSLHSGIVEVSLEHIKEINEIAKVFFFKNGADKTAYRKLRKTSIWKGGKYMLFNFMFKEYKSFCPICNEEMTPYSSVLHHINYEQIFGLGNCIFVCSYQCHNILHNLNRG